jgi:hypothetical protein
MTIKICKKHGELKEHDLTRSQRCLHCARGYWKKYKEKNKDKVKECQKNNRQKRLNNRIAEKACKTHGVISSNQIDKWHRCILCRRVQNRKVYCRNDNTYESRLPENRRKRYHENHKRYRGYSKKHSRSEEAKKQRNIRHRDYTAKLSDGYLRFHIARKYGFVRKEIPDTVKDLEKQIMMIKRKLKNKLA